MALKTHFIIIFSLLSTLIFAQQNEAFGVVKNYYDNQRQLLKMEFAKRLNIDNELQKIKLRGQFDVFMKKMDSVENNAYIAALITTKNEEELKPILNAQSLQKVMDAKHHTIKEKAPEYPGGIDALRKQVGELFYFDSNVEENQKIMTTVSFIVEQDGHISNVIAHGNDANFNRQAMIAVYLLPFRFKPAILDGQPVRYRFSLPLTMTF